MTAKISASAPLTPILPQPVLTSTPAVDDKVKKLLTTFPTPEKYYPMGIDPKKKTISVFLSPSVKKQEDAIYKFRRKSDQKSYVGMASVVSKRVSGHLYGMRHPDKEAGKSELAKAVRENPDDFEFGILVTKEKIANRDLEEHATEELEAIYIEYTKAKAPVFNKRKGGGGGASKKAKTSKQTQKQVSRRVQATYTSPKKSYKLDSETFKVQLTPSAKGDLYIIKRVQKLEGKDVIKRYVGQTERAVKKRLGEHSHYARHPEKPRGKKELYSDIRKFPEEFEVKVLSSKELGYDDLDQMETGHIEFFKEKDAPLYNANKGGGGGRARKSLNL